MDENDTILTEIPSAEAQRSYRDITTMPEKSNQYSTFDLVGQVGLTFLDPFGLLRKVIETATFPRVIEELSLYAMLILTFFWDLVIVMTLTWTTTKLLWIIIYCMKKASWLSCCLSSGKNKRAIRQLFWKPRSNSKNQPRQNATKLKNILK